MTFSTSIAAAHAKGFAPYVENTNLPFDFSKYSSNTDSFATTADIGTPLPKHLAIVTLSGSIHDN